MTAIDFVLEGLESSFSMSSSGTLEGAAAPTLTTDAVATVEVPVSVFTNIFKYKSDSLDVDDVDATDIQYYVYKSGWSGDVITPGEAVLESGAILAGADLNNLKHDFVRYLAVKLFNTHHGVDLFSNEAALLSNIVSQGLLVNGSIRDHLDLADVNKAGLTGDAGSRYQTNAETGATNFSRVLLQQMMHTSNGKSRFAAIAAQPADANAIRSIPFHVGDSVSFKLTVNPNTDQQKLTNPNSETQLEGRTYKIKMNLVA